MTATLFSLHRTLWKRSVSSNAGQVMMPLLLALYGLIGIASLMFAFYTQIGEGQTYHLLSIGSALGVVVFGLLAVIMPAGEAQLSPRTLGVFPLTPPQILPGLALSALWTMRTWVAIFCSLVYGVAGGIVLGATGWGVGIIAFELGVVLSWATAVLFAELLTQVSGVVMESKRTTKSVVGSLGIFVLVLGVLQLNSLLSTELPLGPIGQVLSWTPLAAAVGWAFSLHEGALLAAAAQLLIALLTVAVLAFLWSARVRYLLSEPARAGEEATTQVETRGVSKLELGRWSYSSPAAMEFSRTLRYITRDQRLISALIMLPVFVGLILWQMSKGEYGLAQFYLVLFGVVSGIIASNDYGYDGPSYWVKFVAPVASSTFLRARHWGQLFYPFLGLVLMSVVLLVGSPDHGSALGWICVAWGIFASTAGVSVLLTAFNPYPLSRPGTNAWNDKSGYSATAFVSAMVSFFLSWVPALPAIILLVVASPSVLDSTLLWGIGVVLALLIPGVLYAVALRVAGKRVDEHMPEIYAKAGHYVN
ncbi:ABC transporter permease [Corynebacterium sp.]|uniref:ABC transporter permease n=1 Tax=Corynebacterium sp. TaxID=1720 RepID=UPI0026DC2C2C|nr:ABC transporter permease [Corynebacterium sp.]MDO5032491.1 ABC transporter permease [Corynebacterium sp.]